MSTPEHQEKLKVEAKLFREKLDGVLRDSTPETHMRRLLCVYAGLITETLMEYDEPDVVMEQAFHRVADLLHCEPVASTDKFALQWDVDRDTEIGRHAARSLVSKLPKGLDDVHEIAIALVLNDFAVWEKEFYPRQVLLRLFIDAVISAITFEMATQDFCDLLIDSFVAEDGHQLPEAVLALAALTGHAMTRCPDDMQQVLLNALTDVMVRESVRHATSGSRKWDSLFPANDGLAGNVNEYMSKLLPQVDEFFEVIGMDDMQARAVALAKATGRMVAVSCVEDVGQIHPSIAKSLAKTGMILGSQYKGEQT